MGRNVPEADIDRDRQAFAPVHVKFLCIIPHRENRGRFDGVQLDKMSHLSVSFEASRWNLNRAER